MYEVYLGFAFVTSILSASVLVYGIFCLFSAPHKGEANADQKKPRTRKEVQFHRFRLALIIPGLIGGFIVGVAFIDANRCELDLYNQPGIEGGIASTAAIFGGFLAYKLPVMIISIIGWFRADDIEP